MLFEAINITITPETLPYIAAAVTAALAAVKSGKFYSNAKEFLKDVAEALTALSEVVQTLSDALADDSISEEEITKLKESAQETLTEASDLLGYATGIWSILKKKS